MRYAVFHAHTLELLGSLDEKFAELQRGPVKDGRPFQLPTRFTGFARFDPNAAETAVLRLVTFEPLSLNRNGKKTFVLFVDHHPDDLAKVEGFEPHP